MIMSTLHHCVTNAKAALDWSYRASHNMASAPSLALQTKGRRNSFNLNNARRIWRNITHRIRTQAILLTVFCLMMIPMGQVMALSTGSVVDCDDPNDWVSFIANYPGGNCQYPQVGGTSFRSILFGNDSYTDTMRTLIHKDDTKIVFLGAMHNVINEEVFAIAGFPYQKFPEWRASLDRRTTDAVGSAAVSAPFNRSIGAGTRISAPQFLTFFNVFEGVGFGLNGTAAYDGFDPLDSLDVGVVVFPINAMTDDGKTLADLWGGVAPAKLIADTDLSVEDLPASGTYIHVGSGSPTNGLRRYGPQALSWVFGNYVGFDRLTFTGGGDSGGPIFYESGVTGEEPLMIGTFTGLDGGELKLQRAGVPIVPEIPVARRVFTRLDHPAVKSLLSCIRDAAGATYEEQLANIQSCVCVVETFDEVRLNRLGEEITLERKRCSSGIKMTNMMKKHVICHIPDGDISKAHDLEVGIKSVPEHRTHGDAFGPCP